MKQDNVRQTEVSGEQDRRWEEFLRYATDRLKTPVTVMGLALQRMDGAQDEEERGEFLEMAKRGQQNLEQAVQEVLDMARRKQVGGNENDTK